MKNLYITFLTLIATTGFAQTTIFSENCGTPPTGNPSVSTYSFQNGTPIVFTGTADVRLTTPSDTYTGASGSGMVFIGAALPSKTFQIDGINTLNYTDLTLSFGQWKSTNAGSNEMTVEVSDGVTWTPLTYTRSTGVGTSAWTLITPTGTIPTTANLSIRFINPTNSTTPLSVGYRIDDIKLVGTPISLNVEQNSIPGLKIYPNPAKNTFSVTSNNFTSKTVELYDVVGKLALKTTTTNTPINLADLTSGVYIIKVTEEGKTATRKLVIE